MKNFLNWIIRYKVIIASILLLFFTYTFLTLPGFDPTHPSMVSRECFQSMPQCRSQKESLFVVITTLLFFSGLFYRVLQSNPVVNQIIRGFHQSDTSYYRRNLYDPVQGALQKGLLYSTVYPYTLRGL